MRILVVEDHPMNRELLRALLTARGHEVHEAADVQQACAALSTSVPDLALIDIQIPGGSGEDVLRALRASPAHRDTVAIAVTALAMRDDRERLLALGFDGYASKPIDTRAFPEQVQAWLAQGRREGP